MTGRPARPVRFAMAAAALSLPVALAAPDLAGAQPSAVQAASPAPHTLASSTLVSAPPAGATSPDDITLMAARGLHRGRPLIWTAYQNGINADGTPGTTGGPTQSTVAGYDPKTGALVTTIPVTGKVDGLTADPYLGALVATDNEDVNSGFNLVYPATGAVTHYTYSPDPAVSGNGGTDSIAVRRGQIIVAHSNPNDTSQPTDYRVTLDPKAKTATLTGIYNDDSTAADAVTGKPVTLGLTDPDTNYVMPGSSPRFAGQLATISQADGQIIFSTDQPNPRLSVLNVSDNQAGNVPPLDGLAVATTKRGTLYVVDSGANKMVALDTKGYPAGTVFVGEPKDNKNPLVGTLNLSTGAVTPLGNSFVSPKGLLFVPGPS